MNRSLLALALALAAGAAQAHDHRGTHVGCDMDSPYSLSTYRSAFVFERTDGKPARITLGGGKLFVDGKEAELNDADRARVREFEGELRQLMPEAEKVTAEAIDIAFTALTEVARGLSSDPDRTIRKLNQSRALALREVHAKPSILFRHDGGSDAIDGIIDPIVSEFVPEITGGAVRFAMKAVFASDKERQEMQARMERMEKTLDREVDDRAKALEPMAEAMCERMRRMDGIENALDYRLPGGQPIELLTVDSKESTAAP